MNRQSALSPDYSHDDAWLLRPDPPVSAVDVFYIIPTEYHRSGEPPVCSMDDHEVRRLGLRHLQHKASAFFPVGNVYAPMYRQSNVDCLVGADKSPKLRRALVDGPVASVGAAFDYYMTHLNGGRPFILAGHSQGALMAKLLLESVFVRHPEYHDLLIAAYLIGFSITRSELAQDPHLRFAAGPDDTDVIISYNTEAPGVTARNITLIPGSPCINPITWRRDSAPASAEQSRGGHFALWDKDGRLCGVEDRPHYADAAVDPERGVIVCRTADPDEFRVVGDEAGYFPAGVLHTGDIPLYYYDLRANALNRAAAWMGAHRSSAQ